MEITNKANGKKAFGLVRDECPGCGAGDIGERTHVVYLPYRPGH